MPLYKSIAITPETTAYIWKNSEDVESLFDAVSLNTTSKMRLEKMNALAHKKGYLGVRMLLQYVGYTDFDLLYDANGKPYLMQEARNEKKNQHPSPKQPHISISHSHEFSCICLSNEPIGIDLELKKSKILQIAPRFMDTKHLEGLSEKEQIEKATIIWGIKESIFKIKSEKGISFPNHIFEEDFELSQGYCNTTLDFKNQKELFKIQFYNLEDYIFVCALNY
jgi:phosphopantetheinyl transferase